jgi:hypothetical protein
MSTTFQPSPRPHPLYLAEVNLGRLGKVFIETDRDENSRDFILGLIRSGEREVVKVIEVDEVEGTCRDVTEEILSDALSMMEAA